MVGGGVDGGDDVALKVFHEDDVFNAEGNIGIAGKAPAERSSIDRHGVAAVKEDTLQLQRILDGECEIDFHGGHLNH